MAKLTFKTAKCKGCGLCVDACPKNVLALAADKINKKIAVSAEELSAFSDEERAAMLDLVKERRDDIARLDAIAKTINI